MNHFSRLACLGLTLSLGACTVLESDRINYKSAAKTPSLEIPPDLTQITRDTRYAVAGAAVSASGFKAGSATTQSMPTAASALGDVRIERSGTQRWLVIDRPAEKLWEPVKDFWQESGFLLSMDQSNLGIMETDWAENRAKIPQDFLRAALGKVLDGLYSTGERDKFRTRLERNPNGGTDVFISHRGMIEVYSTDENKQTVWQPRAADPELETEFLRRLMVKLGVSETQSKAVVAAGAVSNGARVATVNGQSVVQIDDPFDRAWRRVGLSLDRSNFTVEDRDRSKGIYFVRYVVTAVNNAEPGFFSKLFSSSKPDNTPQKFRVSVTSAGRTSTVAVQKFDGSAAAAADVQRIVQVLADDLK